MKQHRETDNSHIGPKLELRRHFLRGYHVDTKPYVFDACQGRGVIWRRLREEWDVRYFGVDLKNKVGRLTLDSRRVLAAPGWKFDIIDVDPYGSPWAHWESILAHGRTPLTVFLTVGAAGPAGNFDATQCRALGITWKVRDMPTTLGHFLTDLSTEYCLALALSSGWRVIECQEATRSKRARYFGLRIAPTP